jgi:hypothetical protein
MMMISGNRALVAMAVIVCIFGCGMKTAGADNDFIVYSPYVTQGQNEVEMYGFAYQDARSNLNGTRGYNVSVAHAVTNWWKPELYIGEFNRDPGGATHPSGYEFENTFELTPRGEYWADMGFQASYVFTKQPGIANRAEFGPLFEKWSGHIDQRLNLIWEKEVGGGAGRKYVFRSAYSVSYKINFNKSAILPGIEFYGRPGDNAYQIGPVIYGELRTDAGSELEYSVGTVYGINQGAPTRTLLVRAEYEFF